MARGSGGRTVDQHIDSGRRQRRPVVGRACRVVAPESGAPAAETRAATAPRPSVIALVSVPQLPPPLPVRHRAHSTPRARCGEPTAGGCGHAAGDNLRSAAALGDGGRPAGRRRRPPGVRRLTAPVPAGLMRWQPDLEMLTLDAGTLSAEDGDVNPAAALLRLQRCRRPAELPGLPHGGTGDACGNGRAMAPGGAR